MTNNPNILNKFGNVVYVDPNYVNVNRLGDKYESADFQTNGIPQYQDMYIMAELTATRRSRSVLIKPLNVNKYYIEPSAQATPETISFLGEDQNKENNPYQQKFTTNYYDGSNLGRTQYEGFGITRINVLINSSFIPQVTIQFVDTRGLAFFNQENSPYRMLFDFPPPIFSLTIKGYYGKSTTYQLHLVKYTTDFKAENGNFVIDANFIAVTFAPLSDIPFRYVVNFPLMLSGSTMNPASTEPPKNTYELILKLKELYKTDIKTQSKIENDAYDNSLNNIAIIDEAIAALNNYNEVKVLSDAGNPQLAIYDQNQMITQEMYGTIEFISNLNQYDDYIKNISSSDVFQNLPNRLYLVINIFDADIFPYTASTINIITNNSKVNNVISALETYSANYLIVSLKNLTINKDSIINSISKPKIIEPSEKNSTNIQPTLASNPRYVGIDLTYYYYYLYNAKITAEKTKLNALTILNTKVNNIVIANLGMNPTIYNVFKIILDDVDVFFRTLNETAIKAENHHTNYYDKIVSGEFKDVKDQNTKKVYAFPLIIKTDNSCESRIAPIELSDSLVEPFPEINLVRNFINTFLQQADYEKLYTIKTQLNANGSNVWLPVSPQDTILGNSNIQSPYFFIDSMSGYVSTSEDDALVSIMKVLLPRYYILTQSALKYNFYQNNEVGNLSELYSQAEATNLAIPLLNPTLINRLKTTAELYKNDANGFYQFLQTKMPEYYTLPAIFGDDIDFNKKMQLSNQYIYIDKSNPLFSGCTITDMGIVQLTVDPNDKTTPIGKFYNDRDDARSVKKIFTSAFWSKNSSQENFDFSNENLFYIKDVKNSTNGTDGTNSLSTKFITRKFYLNNDPKNNYGVIYVLGGFPNNKQNIIEALIEGGNNAFNNNSLTGAPKIEYSSLIQKKPEIFYSNIVDLWIDQFINSDSIIYNAMNTNSIIANLLILSNFGYTLSPFNIYPYNLNQTLFNVSSAIQVPKFLSAYLGLIVDVQTKMTDPDPNKKDTSEFDAIYDFFVNGEGKSLSSSGLFIFADIHDIIYLCLNDIKTFKLKYDQFINSSYDIIRNNIIDLYNTVNDGISTKKYADKKDAYSQLLSPDTGSFYHSIFDNLLSSEYLLVNNQMSFQMTDTTTLPKTYISIKEQNTNSNLKAKNDSFFKGFFTYLSKLITDNQKNLDEQQKQNRSVGGDEDIITQTYYSFKTINDKWLPNLVDSTTKYPFSSTNNSLIDLFAFVDRAMNPAGDTVINVQPLAEYFDSPDVTLFTVLSNLISSNGFEFFPLQNFMNFQDLKSWESCFKIDASGNVDSARAAFICMYIGGTSSYPSNMGVYQNIFKDDGILDIKNPGTPDFNVSYDKKDDVNQLKYRPNPQDDNQMQTNSTFPWGSVNAFGVRFGEQNQSMFTGIKIDSKEYPETNESIQILSRLAGDNKASAPTPKAQNLYNLYENRSYRATITALGNAMIQPTQYFQLDNVPIFNGAYLILSVEHDIVPNKMTTTFSGTKILKYPVPRVKNASSSVGFAGGNSDQTNPNINIQTTNRGAQAQSISKARLDQLDCVFGIDVSRAQGFFDWKSAVGAQYPEQEPFYKIDFAFIKVSQKNYADSQGERNANQARDLKIKFGYYHFAEPYSGNDFAGNAKEQADYFMSVVRKYPVPNFPLVLDIEDYTNKSGIHNWSANKDNNDLWIQTFIDTLQSGGYSTIIYSGVWWLDPKTKPIFGKYPLWHSQYPSSPELTDPKLPIGWNNWVVWQFSSQGSIRGYSGDVDLNMMKKNFFNSY